MSEKVVIAEKQDAWVYLTLKDEDGTSLAVGAINALYYTLYDDETAGVINSRTSVLVNPAANPYSLHLEPLDNVIVTATKAEELHRLEILYTYNSSRGNALSARDVILLYVKNLTKVT